MQAMRCFLLAIVSLVVGGSALTSQPTTKPTTIPARTFKSVQDMLKMIPQKQRPPDASKLTDLQISALNETLNAKVDGQVAQLWLEVGTAEVTREGGYKGKARIVAAPFKLAEVPVFVFCYFEDEKKKQAAQVNTGESVQVLGTIRSCYFQRENNVRIIVDLWRCDLDPKARNVKKGS
jgi:hypothetical protein